MRSLLSEQHKVSCVLCTLCNKQQSSSMSVMPILALLRSQQRFLILAINICLLFAKSGSSQSPLNIKGTPLSCIWSKWTFLTILLQSSCGKFPDFFSDELILPARIAYQVPQGRELRQGQFPGIAETNTASNGCYNSDRSKGSIPLTVKFQPNSVLQMLKVREIIDSLLGRGEHTSGHPVSNQRRYWLV